MSGGHDAGNSTRLRLARQARGFPQQQLAGMAGVSRQAVSAVESGLSDPSPRVAVADAGIASEPAARAHGLGFVPLAAEHFDLAIPATQAGSREVQALLKVLPDNGCLISGRI